MVGLDSKKRFNFLISHEKITKLKKLLLFKIFVATLMFEYLNTPLKIFGQVSPIKRCKISMLYIYFLMKLLSFWNKKGQEKILKHIKEF
jgi:hypothetical protein